jgi:flagellar hook-associated protein 3 FlgL
MRVSENQIARRLLSDALRNRVDVGRYSQELASGYKAERPGDSKYSATISQLRDTLTQVDGFKRRASAAFGLLQSQDNALASANDILVRAQELATQGANETNGAEERRLIAQELYELRTHLVNLANTQYQGRYVFSGNADDTPAFSPDLGNPFTVPGDGSAADTFYVYNSNPGSLDTREVRITSEVNIHVNANGSEIFGDSITALTNLARALDGYNSEYEANGAPPPALIPDNAASTQYNFPDDTSLQTQSILAALDDLKSARETQVMPERVNLAGRMRRVETAESLLELSANSARDVLSGLQDTDMTVSSSNLVTAQTALTASLQVTTQMLRTTILNFL